MSRALLIAEKPSLMREIQTVYENHKSEIPYQIDFESQRGHLLTTMEPNEISDSLSKISWNTIPIFPENYGGWKYKIIDDKKVGNYLTSKERYAILQDKIHNGNYDFIIHAGDPDQEGELLVNLVLIHIKTDLPIKRFWTNDLTEGHVLNALLNLRDDRNDPDLVNLLDAAFVRQHSDWLFGMNISRSATLKMDYRVACGRVMTFIQSCVVQRDKAIADFKSEKTYGVKVNYDLGFSGSYFDRQHIDDSNDDATEDQKQGIVWFKTKEEAQNILDRIKNEKNAKVLIRNAVHKKQFSPSLFKLSSLQIYAGKYGLSPDAVLSVVQSLYEKKIMSYPRTSCEYIGSDEDFKGILRALSSIDELLPYINKITDDDIERVRANKKWVNDKKIQTEGHTALRPTTLKADLYSLTPVEQKIYIDIAKRFVCMFLQPWEYEEVNIISTVNGISFKSSGKTTTSRGYLDLLGQKTNDVELPNCGINDLLSIKNFEIPEKETKCPAYFTQADLIAVCENPAKYLDDKRLKSLGKRLTVGTEATRAGIINKLINKNKYLETFTKGKKEYVRATKRGTEIIKNLDGLMICKPDMTGEWEEYLEKVRKGEASKSDIEDQIKKELVDMINEIKEKEMSPIGCTYKCPKCGSRIIEHAGFYGCSKYPDCSFAISKNPFGAKLKESDFDLLFAGKKTDEKSMKTKAGKSFKGQLFIDPEKDYKYGIEFNNHREETNYSCPQCGRKLVKGDKGWSCPGYSAKDNPCHFTIWYSSFGGKLKDSDIEELLTNGITSKEISLKSKAGNKYKAKLKLENNQVMPAFENGGNNEPPIKTDFVCPNCGKSLIKRGNRLDCEGGEKCGFRMYTTVGGKTLTDARIEELIENSVTGPLSGLKGKSGKEFSALIKRDDKGKLSYDFNFQSHT